MNARLVLGLALAANVAAQLHSRPVWAEDYAALVTGVTAGDIYQVDRKGKEQLVVLYGVLAGPSPLAAKLAKEFAIQKVLNQHVTVRIVDRRPGMTLVEFTLADGSNLSHLMLRKGLLRWDSFTARDDQGLKDLEALAKQEKLGIWRGAAAEVTQAQVPPSLQQSDSAATGEAYYERRIPAGYDILEGRSWVDENGVRTIVLRGNGAGISGFEAAVEQQAKDEIEAYLEEQAILEMEQAAAQAEADRRAYEEQLRADQEAAQQWQTDNYDN